MRISQATSTSLTGSAVSETRIVSPIPSISSEPIPTALLIAPANGVPASVTPRWSGYGTLSESIRYARIIVGHVRRLDRDLEVAVVEPLEDLDLLERLHDERLGRVLAARASSRCSGSEPAFAPIRIGMPGALGGLDDLLRLVGAADVARD